MFLFKKRTAVVQPQYLSEETLTYLALFLHPVDICELMCTCKTWYRALRQSESFWQNFYIRDFGEPISMLGKSWFELYGFRFQQEDRIAAYDRATRSAILFDLPLWLEAFQRGDADHQALCMRKLRALLSIDFPPVADVLAVGIVPELWRLLQHPQRLQTVTDALVSLRLLAAGGVPLLEHVDAAAVAPALAALWRAAGGPAAECFQLAAVLCGESAAVRDALVAAGLVRDAVAQCRAAPALADAAADMLRAVVVTEVRACCLL
jgi:hypothetical protein